MLSDHSTKKNFIVPLVTESDYDTIKLPIVDHLVLEDRLKPLLTAQARDCLFRSATYAHLSACHALLSMGDDLSDSVVTSNSASRNLKDPSAVPVSLEALEGDGPIASNTVKKTVTIVEPIESQEKEVMLSNEPTRAQKRKAEGTHTTRCAGPQKIGSSSPLTSPSSWFSALRARLGGWGWWGGWIRQEQVGGIGIDRQDTAGHYLQHVHHGGGSR